MKRKTFVTTISCAAAAVSLTVTAASASVASNARKGAINRSARQLTLVKFGAATPSGQFDAIPYGVYHGIFKKYGIDLQMNWAAGGSSSIVPELANNDFQLSQASPTTMMADYESGVKTLAILGLLQQNPIGVSINSKFAVKKPQQLAGLTVVVGSGTSSVGIAAAYLAHYGLSEGTASNQVNVVQVPIADQAPEVGEQEVNGTFGDPPALDVQINALGVKTTDLFVTSAGPTFDEINEQWVVGANWAASHATALKKLTEALVESEIGAIEHPIAAAQDLDQAEPQTAQTEPIAEGSFVAEEAFYATKHDVGHPIGWQSPKDWADTLAFSEKYAGVQPMNVSVLYTNKYLPSNDPIVNSYPFKLAKTTTP